MSRPKKTLIERAVEAVKAIPADRAAALVQDVLNLRAKKLGEARASRQLARKAKGQEVVRLVAWAQGKEDAARDVGKLLVLLDAIGGAS